MPTILFIYGLRFFFYSEEHLPIHVHVRSGDGRAKINVTTLFPRLFNATPFQRSRYEIGLEGDDLRWEDIDEDIHISSFISN